MSVSRKHNGVLISISAFAANLACDADAERECDVIEHAFERPLGPEPSSIFQLQIESLAPDLPISLELFAEVTNYGTDTCRIAAYVSEQRFATARLPSLVAADDAPPTIGSATLLAQTVLAPEIDVAPTDQLGDDRLDASEDAPLMLGTITGAFSLWVSILWCDGGEIGLSGAVFEQRQDSHACPVPTVAVVGVQVDPI